MHVNTTRFGTVSVEDDRVIDLPAGLLGFSGHEQWVLLQPDDDGIFFWLQSVDRADLAFVVTDPTLWITDYEATIRREQMEALGLDDFGSAQVFVIVNRYDGALTANLQGPLVVNVANRRGMQLVLADNRWTTRHEIVQIEAPARMATA